MPLMVMQDCPSPLIYSTTEPILALVRTGLASCYIAFLVSVQQWKALERTQQHEYASPDLPKIYQKPPKCWRLYITDT